MGISLLWLWDLSLVSGKLSNVELKEILCPTCLATAELSNTNKAHCLFKGEKRSVTLKTGSAVTARFLLSPLLLIYSSVGFESWVVDLNKEANKWFMEVYWVMLCLRAPLLCSDEAQIYLFGRKYPKRSVYMADSCRKRWPCNGSRLLSFLCCSGEPRGTHGCFG